MSGPEWKCKRDQGNGSKCPGNHSEHLYVTTVEYCALTKLTLMEKEPTHSVLQQEGFGLVLLPIQSVLIQDQPVTLFWDGGSTATLITYALKTG